MVDPIPAYVQKRVRGHFLDRAENPMTATINPTPVLSDADWQFRGSVFGSIYDAPPVYTQHPGVGNGKIWSGEPRPAPSMSVGRRGGEIWIPTHGTTGYGKGCRCDYCRLEMNAYQREYVRRREAGEVTPAPWRGQSHVGRPRNPDITHGDQRMYRRGCRCGLCTDAWNVYQRERYAQKRALGWERNR